MSKVWADPLLGGRMKAYEAATRAVLPPHTYTILRVDGRAFHTYLRSAPRPFDPDFIEAMQHVAQVLCNEAQGAVFAYGQSDEISVLMSDVSPQAQPWFGGVVQKMSSVAAGLATAALIAKRGPEGLPHFDARVFTVTSIEAVGDYFLWRMNDAQRNSISMAAQALFSHKQLHRKSSRDMLEMLKQEGVDFNQYPFAFRNGWHLDQRVKEMPVSYVDKRTGETRETVAMRSVYRILDPVEVYTWRMIPSLLRLNKEPIRAPEEY